MHLVCLWDSRAKWAGTLWHGGARPGQEGAGGRRGADSGRPTLGEGGSSSVDYCTTTVTVLDQVWRHKTELYCALLPRTQVPLLAVLRPVASDPGPPPCCTAPCCLGPRSPSSLYCALLPRTQVPLLAVLLFPVTCTIVLPLCPVTSLLYCYAPLPVL